MSSWCVFSEEREWKWEAGTDSSLVIRHVFWDREADTRRAMAAKGDEKWELAEQWPTIRLRNVYVDGHEVGSIVQSLQEMDEEIEHGIHLSERDGDLNAIKWDEIEVLRLFDWGHVQASWTRSLQNTALETLVARNVRVLKKVLMSLQGLFIE